MATYKEAGVDIAAGEETVDRIKPMVRATFTPRVLTDIGMFGAFFDAKFPEYEHPVLVSSMDGVGTKLKVAFMAHKHDTVGQDLVNHCVNDILVCGAMPLYFMDYFATGKLDPSVAAEVIGGLARACGENGCALIGGETAEMPSMYAEGEYDMAGTIVGVVEKSRILNGERVQTGDVLLGLASTGLHTNGYSLARAVLFKEWTVNDYIDELGQTLGEALLAVHKSYLPAVRPLLEEGLVHGLSHITGGGIVGNTKRILPTGTTLDINWNAWEIPPIFRLIQSAGSVDDESMREAFNLGIGLVMVAPEENIDRITTLCGEKPIVLGRIAAQ
jgi:phosphoribosylformylglycinamidine cyclo-ligase